MKSIRRTATAILLLIVTAWSLCGTAHAVSVLAGSDYLATTKGAFFDFGPGIGQVPLQGLPIGPFNTDTIVQR